MTRMGSLFLVRTPLDKFRNPLDKGPEEMELESVWVSMVGE